MAEEIKPTEETLYDRTVKIVAELKEENNRKDALMKEEQKMRSENMLSGRSEMVVQKPVEETPKEYAARIMRGGK